MAKIRCFLALPASSAVQSAVASLIADLQSEASDVKWQDPKKLHLTLKFLGSVEAGTIQRISEALFALARYHSAFDIVYEGLGGFPSLDRPTVLWLGTRPSEPIERLSRDVEDAVSQFGFERDIRSFHPHLTLARIKRSKHLHRLTAKVKSLTFEPVLMRCTEMLVMRSELHPESSRYTVVQSIPLLL
ncbi:MAG: RNA 2',3'-cyclic phosphodiesterase [Bacteroidota bacterium]